MSPQPDDIAVLYHQAKMAADQYLAGEIDDLEFRRWIAWITLCAQGCPEPTLERLEVRMREMDTATSFISAAPTKEQDQ
ncbi:hypothetical protein MELE44368_01810 [Mycolicibacterium elephantis DSM 44368]|uniref:Uncharacterized protein n=1 Tax=Mycolicibacterium elephantis DSM 44368 TaxID=1335622 RepID=A0A439E0N4_9MYCO|nr:hypothetical protein MELE44368_01810 [Mycolicibacterium elephantis DSM 44368]